jgi:hypothetical protein
MSAYVCHKDKETGIEFHIYSKEQLYPNDVQRIVNEWKKKNPGPHREEKISIHWPF